MKAALIDAAAQRWATVRPDFDAGILSLREIAAKHSTEEWSFTHPPLARYANEHGWERNLTAAIQRRADAKVQREIARAARPPDAPLDPITERQVIEANAERIALVRGTHRVVAAELIEITKKQLATLKAMSDAEMLAHYKVSKSVADQLRTAVDIENGTYGIGKDAPPESPPGDNDQPIDVKELALSVAFLLMRTVVEKAKEPA